MLDKARSLLSWQTYDDEHKDGYLVMEGDASHLSAMYIKDGRIECDICGTERRREATAKSLGGFADRPQLHLTLVMPNTNARDAISKQLREKGGIGWYVPILGATALVSDTTMLSKGRTSYSAAIPEAERKATFEMLTDLWHPHGKRMTWVNWSTVSATEAKGEGKPTTAKPRTVAGFTNTTLPKHLDESDVLHIQFGGWLEIDGGRSDPGVQKALRDSNFKPKREAETQEEVG